jgi:hypothetical protein
VSGDCRERSAETARCDPGIDAIQGSMGTDVDTTYIEPGVDGTSRGLFSTGVRIGDVIS